MFTPWRELVELYNPGPSSRRCHSSCGTILAVSDSEDSSEEEEEEEERSRDHIKHGTSSNAAAAGGASENLNKLKADFKPKQILLQNGSSPSPLIKVNDLKNDFRDFTEITDGRGLEETDGGGVEETDGGRVEESDGGGVEETDGGGVEETDGGGVEETDGDDRGTLSSSPYFTQTFAGLSSIQSSTLKALAARPTTASGSNVATSSVVARAKGGGGSTVHNGGEGATGNGGEGIEESGVYEKRPTTTTVRGVLLPVSPVSPVCQKQTSITSKSKSQQALGVPQIMRLASRDVTSCLDLAVIASTDQVKKKKATKKNISTSPKPIKGPVPGSQSVKLHKARNPKRLRKLLNDPSFDPNAVDHHNDTLLHKFVREGKHDLLLVLLTESKGVRVNEKNSEDNSTPLHIAAAKDEKLIMKTLIAFGADLTALDVFNRSPVDVAKKKVKDMMQMLSARPKIIQSPLRHRGFSMINQNIACAREMIGFYLNQRREARLCLDIENEIKRMLQEEEQNDISQSVAGFMQLGDIYKWRKTRGEHPLPGSSILFLDGGGIRGLISIEILMDIEARTEQKIIDLFDWIVGTSTGGIIALALVYGGMTLSDVRDLYIKMAPTIFGGNFFYAKRRSNDMEKLMRETFGEKEMKCIKEPKVMITTVNTWNKTLDVEFFNNFEDNELTEVPVWMVARATSAAPKHFLAFNGYIDGGVKANNPSEFAISRIREYHDSKRLPPPHFSLAVSVGTGYFHKQKWNVGGNLDPMNIFMIKNLFELLLNAISDSEEVSKKFANHCKQVGTKYYRFNPYLEKEIKANETNTKKLLKLITKTKLYLLKKEVLSDLYQVNKAFSELGDLGETLTDYL